MISLHIRFSQLKHHVYLSLTSHYFQPSWRHLPAFGNRTMITYKGSDVKLSWEHANLDANHIGPRMCGYIREGDELLDEAEDTVGDGAEGSVWTSNLHREKRQIDQYEYTPTKTRCPLLLVADYRFFQEMGGGNSKTTINYLVTLVTRHNRSLFTLK